MITCISSSPNLLKETVNTLRFAQRAKYVKNKPVVNYDSKSKLIHNLSDKVLTLHKKLTLKEEQLFICPVELK